MTECDPIIDVPEGRTVYVLMPGGQIGHINGPVTLEVHGNGESFVSSRGSYVCTNDLQP